MVVVQRNTVLRVVAFVTLAAIGGGACDEGPTRPSSDAIVTFSVADERFRVLLTTAAQIAAARAAQSGGRARIPVGQIVTGTQVNAGWSWHLEDVEFAEVTIELCDGRPSDVERSGPAYGGGRYCPWAATVVTIEER